jgi:raffinose/stachyose/melibiose transport system substrate-binding protein
MCFYKEVRVFTITRRRKALAAASILAVAALTLGGCSAAGGGKGEKIELTWLQGTGVQTNIDIAQSLADAFTAENPDITIKVDPSGGNGPDFDNLVKTRLATGEMSDLLWYNSGSLLSALNPDQTLLNVGDEAWVDDLDPSFKKVVSGANGSVFGAPLQGADIGGILYNKPLYAELGLEVPLTWDEFMDNNAAIKAAGHTAVEQTYGDVWTAQLIQLGDFYNTYSADEDWADKFTANKAKFATTPQGVRSFEKLQDLSEAGYFNADFASATLDDGLRAVASGDAGHYPMFAGLYTALLSVAPEQVEDLGIFAVPGDDAAKNGATVWMPPAVYAPATTKHPEAVKKFLAFVASTKGCDAILSATTTGPLLVKGCTLPDDAPGVIKDLLPYFENGNNIPALEFLSPVKGPNLAPIMVEVGNGTRSGKDAAALYDQDVEKAAQQLGLKGW